MVTWSGEWYYRERGGSWRNRRTGETTGGKREITYNHPYFDDRYAKPKGESMSHYKGKIMKLKAGKRPKLKVVQG